MRENKFKVGDRVRVYSFKSTSINGLCEFKAHIKGVDGHGILRVIERGTGIEYRVWPQQCRRLIPKKPKHGDEIWLRPDYFDLIKSNTISPIITSPFEKHCDTYGWIKYKRCK